MSKSGHQDKRWWVQIAVISTLGIAMAISLLIGAVGGFLLDRTLGTKVFFWAGLAAGILAAYRSLWVMYTKYICEKKPKPPTD